MEGNKTIFSKIAEKVMPMYTVYNEINEISSLNNAIENNKFFDYYSNKKISVGNGGIAETFALTIGDAITKPIVNAISSFFGFK